MTIPWVRRQYGVPAQRGLEIEFEGRPARILSATNYLHVRFLDDRKPRDGYLHPLWHVTWPAHHATPQAGEQEKP